MPQYEQSHPEKVCLLSSFLFLATDSETRHVDDKIAKRMRLDV